MGFKFAIVKGKSSPPVPKAADPSGSYRRSYRRRRAQTATRPTESRYPPRALMAVVSSDGTGHALSTVRSQLLDSLKGSATFDSLKVRPAAQAHAGAPSRPATERRACTGGADAGAQLSPG